MRQSNQAKKDQILSEWVEARRDVLNAIESLPTHMHDMPFLGVWSAHDIAAHLIGWDHANLEGIRSVLAGQLPEFYSQYDTDWRSYNASLVTWHKQIMVSESLAAARASQEALLTFLATVSPDDFSGDHGVRSPRGRRVTVAMLLTVEARDERRHAEQVRAFAAGQSGP